MLTTCTRRMIEGMNKIATNSPPKPPLGIDAMPAGGVCGGRVGFRKGRAIMSKEHFPETEHTYIFSCLRTGARAAELQRHLMAVYAMPLRAYFLGTSFRHIAEPDEIINGFLLDRLTREDFIPKWRASGMRLRRWLMKSLRFYLYEYLRSEGRHAGVGEDVLQALQRDDDHTAELDREFARSIVRRALAVTKHECDLAGLAQHHEFFCRYALSDVTCESLAAQHGMSADRVWVMVRTAQRRFVRALRAAVTDDGVQSPDIDAEIASLLDMMGGNR